MSLLEVDRYSFINCSEEIGIPSASEIDYNRLRDAVGLGRYGLVIALGGFAAGCLRRAGIDHVRMDHPSGVNRNLNDPAYETAMITRVRETILELRRHEQ